METCAGFAGTGGIVSVYDVVGRTVGEREETTGNVRDAAVRDLTAANLVGGKCGVLLAGSPATKTCLDAMLSGSVYEAETGTGETSRGY